MTNGPSAVTLGCPKRDGRMVAVAPDPDGTVHIAALDVRVATVDGKLRLTWEGGAADI